jgi:hypothetical protein
MNGVILLNEIESRETWIAFVDSQLIKALYISWKNSLKTQSNIQNAGQKSSNICRKQTIVCVENKAMMSLGRVLEFLASHLSWSVLWKIKLESLSESLCGEVQVSRQCSEHFTRHVKKVTLTDSNKFPPSHDRSS